MDFAEGALGADKSSSVLKIADLTDILDSSFLQIHKKYIVNKSFITSYDKTTRYLHINGVALPVGRVYKPEVDYYIDERIQN